MTHSDAIGYLTDLSNEVSMPQWFKMICDLAIREINSLDDETINVLFAIFIERASYLRPIITQSLRMPRGTTAPEDFLESLIEFSNFKLIGNTLSLKFNKRITLIFGANGSGKSSICETLRILASTEKPTRPLHNVRTATKNNSTFKFKFKSDTSEVTWSPITSYGVRRATVKYFDTTIAIRNIKVAVDVGRVVELYPFKLHIFENATTLTIAFREVLQNKQQANFEKLTSSIQAIQKEFSKFNSMPLSHINIGNVNCLKEAIEIGEGFTTQNELMVKRTTLLEMEKATSEDGLKLLKSEEREITQLLNALEFLAKLAIDLNNIDPANKAKAIAEKQVAQGVLAGALVPANTTLEAIITLAKSGAHLCNFDDATGKSCPLCRRDLGDTEIHLFKQYHNLLIGELERDIIAMKAEITNAEKLLTRISERQDVEWSKYGNVPSDLLSGIINFVKTIVDGCSINGLSPEVTNALNNIKTLVSTGRQLAQNKTTAIEIATKGQTELLGKIVTLKKEIEPLAYGEAIHIWLSQIKESNKLVHRNIYYKEALEKFPQILTKITNAAKKAHNALVVADFETRLNTEYLNLTEKNMKDFGVTLLQKGADSTITVLPQIGGKDIDGVLSEGEQRVHALALFFAELETSPQSVIVFDDPISSFDYNHITNYCMRLRDFAKKHTKKQIIALTHNWEFFTQLQSTLNAGGLDAFLSVQVLEHCSAVSEYSEKADELKASIDNILSIQGEPTKPKKEELAGKLRRLIESIVNAHVFANQRQQYKQRKHSVSEFHHYTKLVPLLTQEATDLRDLYAKLSISEHDDPRNSYVNTDKAIFQSRYAEIKVIETAIIGRSKLKS